MERILRNAGAERVSAEAAKRFAEEIEEIADEMAKKAVTAAKHAGRKTVHGTDIKLVFKM